MIRSEATSTVSRVCWLRSHLFLLPSFAAPGGKAASDGGGRRLLRWHRWRGSKKMAWQALRYVFHGYDMAETGARAVCLCASAEQGLKLPEPCRQLSTCFAPVCLPGLLHSKSPLATGTHIMWSPSATLSPLFPPGAWRSRRGCSWRSSNLSGWQCQASGSAGAAKPVAAETGRTAALRLGGPACVIVEIPAMRE